MSDSFHYPSPPPALPPAVQGKTIVLVGMMGVGKTTIGRRLARLIGLPFIDADQEIESAAGMSISDYFEIYGEVAFRLGERRVITRLLNGTPHVLATGGGAFCHATTRALIRQKAISIWLNAEIDIILERTAKRNTRPLLKTANPKAVLEQLLNQRQAQYAEADLHITSEHSTHNHTANKILDALQNFSQQIHHEQD